MTTQETTGMNATFTAPQNAVANAFRAVWGRAAIASPGACTDWALVVGIADTVEMAKVIVSPTGHVKPYRGDEPAEPRDPSEDVSCPECHRHPGEPCRAIGSTESLTVPHGGRTERYHDLRADAEQDRAIEAHEAAVREGRA